MNLLSSFTLLKKTFVLSILATLVFASVLSAATNTQHIDLSQITENTEYQIPLSVGDTLDINFSDSSSHSRSNTEILEISSLSFDTPLENDILSLATQKSSSYFRSRFFEPAIFTASYSYSFTAKSAGTTVASFSTNNFKKKLNPSTIKFKVTVTE